MNTPGDERVAYDLEKLRGAMRIDGEVSSHPLEEVRSRRQSDGGDDNIYINAPSNVTANLGEGANLLDMEDVLGKRLVASLDGSALSA